MSGIPSQFEFGSCLDYGSRATVGVGYGPAEDGLRARYAPASGGLYYLFLWDPQGSVQQRHTDDSYTGGYAAYDRSTFEGYGALRQANKGSTGAIVGQHDPAGFGGQFGYYTDTETGLLCLTHRYHDPGTGKFINRDPIGYAGGANLYAFCAGNPVNTSDPNGTDVDIITYEGRDYAGQVIGTHAAIAVSWPGTKSGMKWFDFGPGAPYDPSAPSEPDPSTEIKGIGYRGEVTSGSWNSYYPTTYTHKITTGDGPQSVVRLKTSAATDRKIRQWLMATVTNNQTDYGGKWVHNGSYGDYEAVYNQCSTYVCDALAAGGINEFTSLQAQSRSPLSNTLGTVTPWELKMYANMAGGKTIYLYGNRKR